MSVSGSDNLISGCDDIFYASNTIETDNKLKKS